MRVLSQNVRGIAGRIASSGYPPISGSDRSYVGIMEITSERGRGRTVELLMELASPDRGSTMLATVPVVLGIRSSGRNVSLPER